jgi:stage V sporulation protein B
MNTTRRKRLSPTITGALVLTMAGLASRFIGFFYRIFLSNQLGAEGMGLFSMVMPVFTICFALCGGAYQTTICAFVAAERKDVSRRHICITGTGLSLISALLLSWAMYQFRDFIASRILMESRCEDLVGLLALTLPFSALHACMNGYFYGLQRSGIPAASQLVEQTGRVACVYIVWRRCMAAGRALTAGDAVIGMLAGELLAVLFLVCSILRAGFKGRPAHVQTDTAGPKSVSPVHHLTKPILTMATPLMLNRLLLSLLSGMEAVWIPLRLQRFGLTNADALSIYGILNGMSMPLILFPSALTNSLAVMLLPDVAQSKACGQHDRICLTATRNTHLCISFGVLFTGIFFCFGEEMGTVIFGQELAGIYIKNLAFLCPFLYLSTTLSSILNGLGHTGTTFVQSCISTLIRLGFVYFLIPVYGMKAYLWGLLVSQLVLTALNLIALRKEAPFAFSFWRSVLIPGILFGISYIVGKLVQSLCFNHLGLSPLISLMGCCGIMMILFLAGWTYLSGKAR